MQPKCTDLSVLFVYICLHICSKVSLQFRSPNVNSMANICPMIQRKRPDRFEQIIAKKLMFTIPKHPSVLGGEIACRNASCLPCLFTVLYYYQLSEGEDSELIAVTTSSQVRSFKSLIIDNGRMASKRIRTVSKRERK